jgi:hypothetical protein
LPLQIALKRCTGAILSEMSTEANAATVDGLWRKYEAGEATLNQTRKAIVKAATGGKTTLPESTWVQYIRP